MEWRCYCFDCNFWKFWPDIFSIFSVKDHYTPTDSCSLQIVKSYSIKHSPIVKDELIKNILACVQFVITCFTSQYNLYELLMDDHGYTSFHLYIIKTTHACTHACTHTHARTHRSLKSLHFRYFSHGSSTWSKLHAGMIMMYITHPIRNHMEHSELINKSII